MKKYICGLYDTLSGNVGDVCLVDNVSEFEWSVRKLLSDIKFPDFAVRNCCAVVYGELHYSLDAVPFIEVYDHTKPILYGCDPDIVRKRMEMESKESEMSFDDE